ncbi:sensor histidine kinase [Azohydromonas aeria]|uniref:sensor histidine kinase n=1 Tax=Azohydromonas aeria TaxID=2590212 RepID=UPI0018E01D6C|nr:GAF domain-containing sensor histidine kinase [Azohydromonas aeria]
MNEKLPAVDLLGSDPLLDNLARSAAGVTGCPIGLVSLVRGEHLWFKGRYGTAEHEAVLEGSLCSRTMRHDAPLLEIPDLQADPDHVARSRKAQPPHLRYYAGVALRLQGEVQGTLSVMGTEPMRLQPAQADVLQALARCAEQWMQERLSVAEALGRLSHEMRTPLNGVLGFAQLLLADNVPGLAPRQLEWVRHLHAGAVHLLSLVEDMLLFSRLKLSSSPLQTHPIGLGAVVQRCVGMLQPLAARSGVRMQVCSIPGDALVCADERALQQVLVNLLSNAIKYNRSDGTVTLSVDELPEAWVVGVRDEGAGMTPEQMARLFRPFDRLGAERSGIEGHGLGLAIVRMLADSMHAGLQVRSAPGQGSLFEIRLKRPAHGKAR